MKSVTRYVFYAVYFFHAVRQIEKRSSCCDYIIIIGIFYCFCKILRRNEFIALVNEYNAVVYKTEIFLPAYACKHRALLFAYYRNTAGFAVFLICGYHIYQGGLTCCTVATKYRDISYNGKLILYTAAFHHHLIFTFHNDTTL